MSNQGQPYQPKAPGISRPRVRFGVMCFGPMLQEWQARCLHNLLTMPDVELALIIVDVTPLADDAVSKLRNVRIENLLYKVYRKLLVQPRARRPTDMSDVFKDVPTLSCKVIRKGKYSQYFSDEDVQAIRSHDLDFILRFGFNIIRGDILQAARHGVWSFHHDDEEKYRGSPPCFWEIYFGDLVTGAILQRLTNRLDGGVVLKKGHFETVDYSYTENLDSVFLESSKWPAQVVNDIRNGAAGYLSAEPSKTTAPVYYPPNNLEMLRFARNLSVNFVRKAANSLLRRGNWNVGIVNQPIHDFLLPGTRQTINWLPLSRKGKFAADPFAIQAGDDIHLLFEDYDYKDSRGKISHIAVSDGRMSPPQTALDVGVHASYPYLLEHEGEVYCVPETFEACEIALYRAVSFPNEWQKVATLVDGVPGVDATIFQHDGHWWMFCGDSREGANLKLYAYHAPDLLGPWTPHAGNPVKTDIRGARSAGTPFVHEGVLYRPAQDCSRTYGGQVTLNRVTKLTLNEFVEEPVTTIRPAACGPYSAGMHTLAALGNMTIVDGKRMVFVRHAFMRTLARELGRRFRAAGVGPDRTNHDEPEPA